ncbi:MAG: hypothetical protein AAFX06_23345 [Planctomycetota bacterium]
MKSLQRLDIPQSSVGEKGFREIARLSKLKQLVVSGTKTFDARSLDVLADLPDLEFLDIHDTGLGGADLRSLAEFPSLNGLVFSMPLTSWSTKDWSDPATLEALRGIRSLEPVGACCLRDLSDKHLEQIAAMDTSRLVSLWFCDSRFTAVGCEKLRGIKLQTLTFDQCQIDHNAIGALRHEDIVQLNLRNDSFSDSKRLFAVTEYLNDLGTVSISKNGVTFLCRLANNAGFDVRASVVWTHPIPRDLFKTWFDQGVDRIRLGDGKFHRTNLESLASLDPPLTYLTTIADDDDWGIIRRMTNLKRLSVWSEKFGALHFTERHQLKSLTVAGGGQLTDDDFHEISKLKRLERLLVNSTQRQDKDVRSKLESLSNLKYFNCRVSQVNRPYFHPLNVKSPSDKLQ